MAKEKSKRAISFGQYIKGLRGGRPLRDVAPQIGLSFPHLGRIERGEVSRPPSLHVLARMATVYAVEPGELMERAGVRVEPERPDHFSTAEQQFESLMLCDEFRPDGMRPEYIPFIPPVVRLLIRDLAANIERHTEARVRWELRDDAEAEPPKAPMRTFANIIGAATVKTVLDPDWKETT